MECEEGERGRSRFMAIHSPSTDPSLFPRSCHHCFPPIRFLNSSGPKAAMRYSAADEHVEAEIETRITRTLGGAGWKVFAKRCGSRRRENSKG
jgi:hypothetical protein